MQVYYWTTIRKNRSLYHASRGIREEDITSILQKTVIIEKNQSGAELQLLLLPGLHKFMDSLQLEKEKDDFRKHMRRYINIYLPDCPFEVTSTNRYTVVTHEASVTARKFIKKGETVKYLCGVQVIMTKEEEVDINQRRRDFSIVVSSRNKSASLFLGPARFANHDCGANAKLITSGTTGMEIIAVRDIEIGDEITVTYGDNYFGEDNCECLCKTCEDNLENGWEQKSDDSVKIVTNPSIEQIPAIESSYSLRRRRKSDYMDASRTPSATPDLRPHVPKRTPKKSTGLAKELSSPEPSPSQQLLQSNKKRLRKEGVDLVGQQMTRKKQCTETVVKQECIPSDLGGLYSTPESSRSSSIFDPKDDSAHVLSSLDNNLTDTTSVDEDTIIVQPIRKKRLSRLSKGMGTSDTPTNIEISKLSSESLMINGPLTSDKHWRAPAILETDAKDLNVSEIRTSRRLKRPSMKLLTKTLASTTKKRKYTKRKPSAITDIDHAPAVRTPGDYVLTSLLLAQPASAWISCKICDGFFVQLDAYLTRSSCPRCERHSKLYGYQWPKTDKEGRNDTEERILDHRTVHRFIRPDEERSIRKRDKSCSSTTSLDVSNAFEARAPEIEHDDTQGRRRSGRVRTRCDSFTL